MLIAAFTILFDILAGLIGTIEALHFWYRIASANNDDKDEHPVFTVERFLMWIPFEYIMYDGRLISLLNGVALAATFVIWHDGMYYWKRHKLKVVDYIKGFWDMTTSSKSWWDRNGLTKPVFRVTYFVIGIVALILINK